ncbi:MAG: hypothetical protein EOQ41_03510 [Mesorhizobium sp.]|uniref:hypothetical protein n=1 Tax=Mesorhizobium sp. TaxID=1871066 RepID=UPI000FE5A529|nr:hypothetical protein [Mesorhizobium sp.]RWB35753.1 MAG: hypothetical protein EOQ41_03510 [Mesorhizobium sp.]
MAEIRRIAAVHNADNARAATSLPDARSVLDLQVLKNAGRCARRLGAFSSGFDPDCAKTGESGKVLNCTDAQRQTMSVLDGSEQVIRITRFRPEKQLL